MISLEALQTGLVSFLASGADVVLFLILFVCGVLLSTQPAILFRARRPAAALAFLIGLRYFTWRGMETLNHETALALAFSLALYLAEAALFVTVLMGAIRGFPQKAPPPGPSSGEESKASAVAILIKLASQSPEALQRTLVGCEAMDYPAEAKRLILICEAAGPEIRALSERFGCRCAEGVTPQHQGNAALVPAFSKDAPFVMVMEAGDVPLPAFLKEAMGQFENKTLAFVQAGCRALTPDPFQQALFLQHEIAHEQELFYRVLCPELERLGSLVSSRKGLVFRTAALAEIQDDVEHPASDQELFLSAALHRRGWRSAYLDQSLLLQTLTRPPAAFFRQRGARIRSALKGLLRGLPFWPGFSFGQRLGYLRLLLNDLLVLPRLVFLIAPLGFLIGTPPIKAPLYLLAAYALPYYLWQMMARYALSRRRRHPLWSAVYETADLSVFSIRAPKHLGRPGDFLSMPILPFLLMGGLQVGALGAGLIQLMRGLPAWPDLFSGGLWGFYNLFLLTAAAASVRGRAYKREHPRIPRPMPCRLSGEGHSWPAQLLNISESGAALKLKQAVELPENLSLSLDEQNRLPLSGRVIRNETYRSGGASIGIRFKGNSEAEQHRLIRWLYCVPTDWTEPPVGPYTHAAALLALLSVVGRVFVDEFDLHRASPRYGVSLPCRLKLQQGLFPATITDISASGIALKLEEEPGPLSQQIALECRLSEQDFYLNGRAMWSRQREGHWEIGLHFGKADGQPLLQAALPQAHLKIVERGNFQSRSLRFMGYALAYACSIFMVLAVVVISMENGILPTFSSPSHSTTVRYFWLSVFLILVDGIKVYIEISGRAAPRAYRSDLSQVTALIPCHNTGRRVVHTIEALQRVLPNQQILVVDDASLDDTAEIARATGVRVHSLAENVGKSQAITLGLRQVKTACTLILDDDTRFESIFLPTSLLEDGKTSVAFYILPCRRARETSDGKDLITCVQRYEYAKSMEIGKRFQDKTLSVSCVSGAAGLFLSERLREIQALHSDVFPGEDLERTLIHLFKFGGQIAFVNEPVWTIAPDNLKDLTKQRLMNWYPGFYRLFGYFLRILFSRKMPFRLRFEMCYNAYVVLSDPLKVFSFGVLLWQGDWGGIAFLYFFYLALEIYPFLTIEKKLSVRKYYLPAFFLFPAFGLYNAFLRFGALFYWLWERFATRRLKPKARLLLADKGKP